MGDKLGLVLGVLLLIATAEKSFAEVTADGCGTNLSEVKNVIKNKFPQLGTSFIKHYIGKWVYPGYDPLIISENEEFEAMGYKLIICPLEDKSFEVYWKDGKGWAGLLKMFRRNQVRIYQTAYGTIPMDREGTATAAN